MFGLLLVITTLITLTIRTTAIMLGFGVLHHESAAIPAIGFPVAAALLGLGMLAKATVTATNNDG